ncbi:unnamed protein product, partial [marine sediment metagenome]
MACEARKGPDIICSGHEDIPGYAQSGYIMAIADSVSEVKAMAPEFDDVIESLWGIMTWNGKIWAIPQDAECRPMFYSKSKLKELGWSDAKIKALPDKIKNGEYTLDDMIATCQEAIDKGVVEPEYGYWHRPKPGGDFIQYYVAHGGRIYDAKTDKLVIVKDALIDWYKFQRKCVTSGVTPENFIGTEWSIWHENVSHNKALFWNGGIWQWAEWAALYVDDMGRGEL